MALSQKHEGKCLVPWFCSAEWHFVHNKIFGQNSNDHAKREALDIINIWKSRIPLLSRGVDGTLTILEALLIDRNTVDTYDLKLVLSAAIMRFLNICAACNKNQGTFYTTASKMRIPEWLINLRHTIAHGQNLPAVDILDRALKFSLEWLHQEYWKPAAFEIRDFIDYTQFASDRNESLRYILQPLVSNYCYITLFTHPKFNFSKIYDISDEETRNIFVEEIKSMTDFADITETTELNRIIEILWHKIEQVLKEYEDFENRYYVIAELLVEDIFLGEIDDREEIFNEQNIVPKDFIFLWENMLLNFNTDMIGALIEKLLILLLNDTISHESKIVASTWLSEIGLGLDRCMFIKSILKELAKTGSKPRKVLQSIVDEKLIAKYGDKQILKLNSNLEVPDVISDCAKFKKLILEEPTEFTNIFIFELLDLNDSLKLPETKRTILELLNLFTSNDDKNENLDEATKIYNVEELDTFTMDLDDQVEEAENIGNKINDDVNSSSEPVLTNKIWRKVTETNFEKCPIGILPWQSTEVNPFLI